MAAGDIFGLFLMFCLLCWALYLTRDDRKKKKDVNVAR